MPTMGNQMEKNMQNKPETGILQGERGWCLNGFRNSRRSGGADSTIVLENLLSHYKP